MRCVNEKQTISMFSFVNNKPNLTWYVGSLVGFLLGDDVKLLKGGMGGRVG